METSAPAAPQPRRRRLATRFAIGLVAAVALYGLLLGVVAPPVAKRIAADRIGEALGRAVAIEEVSINPYTLRATVRGVRVMEADGRATFASFDVLDVDGSGASFRELAPVVDSLSLTGLKVNVVREAETRFNFSDILARLAARAEARKRERAGENAQAARFSISDVRLVGAAVDFDDRPKGQRHQVADVSIAIPFISSLPTHRKEHVEPAFSATVNGAAVRLAGTTLPFEDTLQTRFELQLTGADVRRYLDYVPAALPVKVESGVVDARIALRFTQGKKDPAVDLSGTVALRDVAVSGEEPLAKVAALEVDIGSLDPIHGKVALERVAVTDAQLLPERALVPAFEARGIALDLKKRVARVASIESRDGQVAVARRPDGSIAMPKLLPVKAEEAASAADATPWSFAVDRLGLVGWTVTLEDAAVKPAATHRVGIDSLEVTGLGNRDGLSGEAKGVLVVGRAGRVELASEFALEPLQVKATVDARGVDLVPLRAYVAEFPTVGLKSGQASARGRLELRGSLDALQLSWRGGAEIARLATVDTARREELLNWKSVRASAIELDLAPAKPLTLGVGEIVVDGIYSRLVVNPDGTLNVQSLKTGAPPEKGPGAPEPAPREVRIDRITFVDGRLDFTDHFIRPNYSANVGALQGSVTGLSSRPESRATVALEGRYDRTSPVTIAGTVNPLRGDLFADVSAKGAEIELPKLTAYSQRYAGYGITAGKLTLDVRYHIDGGKLEGRNKVRVDQLTFGDKVESPEATKLPVLFAVNLLKDSKGQINLELPVSGSLDDPQFDISALAMQVFGTLLKKAVTSPFSLLAAALGGNGGKEGGKAGDPGDLAYVDFEPGAADLAGPARGKLESLVRALRERPGLKLELIPAVDEARDAEALRRAELARRLEALRSAGKAAADDAALLRLLAEREQVLPVAAPAKDPKDAKGASAGTAEGKTPSAAELEALLLARIAIGEAELAELARRRGDGARGFLVAEGRLPPERVVVGTAGEDAPDATRVSFSLR